MNRVVSRSLVTPLSAATPDVLRAAQSGRATKPSAAEPGATLWERPDDLPARDLFYGPWGRERAPDPKRDLHARRAQTHAASIPA